MSDLVLGNLERVDVRQIWTKEHADFTPWLADNLHLIGKIIDALAFLLAIFIVVWILFSIHVL